MTTKCPCTGANVCSCGLDCKCGAEKVKPENAAAKCPCTGANECTCGDDCKCGAPKQQAECCSKGKEPVE